MTSPRPAEEGSVPLTDGELRALREKAEKAGACGAWFNPFRFRCDGHSDADASFIAACDPQTVLCLVDELERLRAALDKYGEHTGACRSTWARSREMIERDERYPCTCGWNEEAARCLPTK